MPLLTSAQWFLVVLGAFGVGLAKSGLSGVSLLHVLIFAAIFHRQSTGVVLPMLLVGDISAVFFFRRHARWEAIRKMLPPALCGIVLGWLAMQHISEGAFNPLIGWIILTLTVLQILRLLRPQLLETVPHHPAFAWTFGSLAGLTTMLANAAGPVMSVYLLAVGLPKLAFIGTSAWFFFILNLSKVPFSISLGLIRPDTLLLNLCLVPAILAGLAAGRWLVARIPQREFDLLLLAFAGLAALRMIGIFSSWF